MTAPTPSPVGYAPPPRGAALRRWRRPLLLLGLIAMAASAFSWGPALLRHMELLRLQRRCMNYARPPHEVAREIPAPFDPVRAQATEHVVSDWEKLYAAISPPGKTPAANIFLHELRNRRGGRRLVAVDAGSWDVLSSVLTESISFTWRTVRPGNAVTKPELLAQATVHRHVNPFSEGVRIWTGQADPHDPSHFTFEFQVGDRRGTFDGWLQDDDTVLIQVRHPLQRVTPPPPASPASLPSAGPAAAGPASRASR